MKVDSALAPNESPQSGTDRLCDMLRTCAVGPPLPAGDGFQLVCVESARTVSPQAPCSPDPAQGRRCAHDSLCVELADIPGGPRCRTLCRLDEDCPVQSGQFCFEHVTDALASGARATLGFCVRAADGAFKNCKREVDCAGDEGCVFYGARTQMRVCRAAAGGKALGEPCAAASECRSGQCLDRDRHRRVRGGRAHPQRRGAELAAGSCGPSSRPRRPP